MKRFSRREANELLPFLAPALIELRDKFAVAEQVREKITTSAMTNGGSKARDEWDKTLARVQELLERIVGWGIELRDIDTGLIDFPTVIDGEEAFYCWKLGEPHVAHWHSKADGFAGRRPLDP